jgi:hypothetical protein
MKVGQPAERFMPHRVKDGPAEGGVGTVRGGLLEF